MKKPSEGWNKEVVIRLKKWQIPRLLGACYLGTVLEDWCASLIQCNINSFDTHSSRWIRAVEATVNEIKNQTGVSEQDVEYGYDDALKVINKWVQIKSKEDIDAYFEWEKAGCPRSNEK